MLSLVHFPPSPNLARLHFRQNIFRLVPAASKLLYVFMQRQIPASLATGFKQLDFSRVISIRVPIFFVKRGLDSEAPTTAWRQNTYLKKEGNERGSKEIVADFQNMCLDPRIRLLKTQEKPPYLKWWRREFRRECDEFPKPQKKPPKKERCVKSSGQEKNILAPAILICVHYLLVPLVRAISC